MESHTNGMYVVRCGHTGQVERQLITLLPRRLLHAIFRLSFADTGTGALFCAFLDHGFSIFTGGVRSSCDGPSLIFGRASGLGGRVFALVDMCW